MHQVTPLSGPLYVVAGVLVVAGATKVMTPAVTATALRRMPIPAPRLAARALGGAELLIALVAIATGSPGAWGAVAGLYGAFTVFMIWALQDGGRIGSCGCFGQEDTPPTPGHADRAHGHAAGARGGRSALDRGRERARGRARPRPHPSWRAPKKEAPEGEMGSPLGRHAVPFAMACNAVLVDELAAPFHWGEAGFARRVRARMRRRIANRVGRLTR